MKVARLADGSPEIFHTLQGEGPSLGAPAVFLRLSLCNLHCHWCDTPYTWNWENTPWEHQDDVKFSKEEQLLEITPGELASSISKFNCPRLVITGGEPLLQQAEFVQLLDLLPDLRFVEIETNCTQIPETNLAGRITQFNISPKLSNSGMNESLRLNPGALSYFAQSDRAVFKFVVCNEEDLQEIQGLQSQFNLSPEQIFLMPEGRDSKTLKKRSLWLAECCRDQGYRFSPRLHVLLWGNERAR